MGLIPAEVFTAPATAIGLVFPTGNQQAASVVPRHDGAQQQAGRMGLAGGNRQQAELGGGGREPVLHRQETANQTEIAGGFGEVASGLRVQEQVGFVGNGGFQAELELGAMHGLARLPGHHPPPAALVEQGSQLGGGMPQRGKIWMRRQGGAFNGPAQIPMARVFPDIGQGHHGQHEPLAVAQRDAFAGLERRSVFRARLQRDGYGPERAVVELLPGHHPVALGTRHETGERRVGTAHEHFEFALLAPVEVERGQAQRFVLECVGLVGIDEVDEDAAIGGDERSIVVGWHGG